MDFLDRWAIRRLQRRGYSPAPSVVLGGLGSDPAEDDSDSVDYLTYARISNVVYACTRLRADALAKLPLRFYSLTDAYSDNRGGRRAARVAGGRPRLSLRSRRASRELALPLGARIARTGSRVVDAGEAVEVEASPLIRVLSRPSDTMTWRTLVYLTEFSMCLAGRSRWLALGRDDDASKDKAPTGLQYVRHDRLTAKRWKKPGDPLVTGWTLDPNTAGKRELPAGAILDIRFPDPCDPDYGALPPLAAGRLGADSYTAAMQANKAIFDNGILTPGMIGPPPGLDGFWTDTQLTDVANALERRAAGRSKAHRLLAVPFDFTFKPVTLTPKDAEFQGLLDFSIEDVGRAYGVPIELIGGNRATYENRAAAAVQLWETVGSEAVFLAEELTERFVPMFGPESGVDFVAFDLSGVSALQEDEAAIWTREDAQIQRGALLTNEWRERHGLEPLANEPVDAAKASAVNTTLALMGQGLITPEAATALIAALGLGEQLAAVIVGDGPPVVVPSSTTENEGGDDLEADDLDIEVSDGAAAHPPSSTRQVPAFGSDDHRALWTRLIEPSAKHETAMRDVVAGLFEAHRDSILDRLTNAERSASARGSRIGLGDLSSLFGRARWIRAYREAARKALAAPFLVGGSAVAEAFDASALKASDPAAVRFLMGRAQRFAVQVNETTWMQLRARLGAAIEDGEALPALRKVVTEVMDGRIRSSADNIARTEVLGAFNGGSRLTARAIEEASGLRLVKTWVTALDERVRDDHQLAHGQTVALNEDFEVGGVTGPGPGEMGEPDQDCQCRCVLVYDEVEGARGMLAMFLVAAVEVP